MKHSDHQRFIVGLAYVRDGAHRLGPRGSRAGLLVTVLALLAGAASGAPAAAQEMDETYQPAQPEYGNIPDVELVASRQDGPPTLVLVSKKGRSLPASGTYRTRDGKSLVVKDGQILELTDPAAELLRFRVASIEKVVVRGSAPDRLFLKNSRGRAVALPDGAFTSGKGVSLVVKDGMVVGYGSRR